MPLVGSTDGTKVGRPPVRVDIAGVAPPAQAVSPAFAAAGFDAAALLATGPGTWQVWVDFDGTITRKDVLDELILSYAADDSWKAIELEWQSGQIGSFDCLRREFDLVRVRPPQLTRFLENIPVDPGAGALFTFLRGQGVPAMILSDGVEMFIRKIMGRIGESGIPIRSNRIEHTADRLALSCPYRQAECESRAAHCKCTSANELSVPDGSGSRRKWAYVGDGRSDLCPARKCDLVFAKGTLARLLTEEGRSFVPFDTLNDVVRTLSVAWVGEPA